MSYARRQSRPEPQIEAGEVKFYLNDERQFGFLITKTGDLYMSHWGAMVPRKEKGQVVWDYDDRSFSKRVAPRKGDVLYFKRGLNRRGETAEQWTFKSWHDQVQAELDSLPVYRLIEQKPYQAGHPNPPRKVWEGKDLDDSNLAYYAISPYDQIETGWTQWWVRQDGDQWVKCDDPRPNPEYGTRVRMFRPLPGLLLPSKIAPRISW